MRPVAVDFAAPVDVVFGYLSDPARRPEWQGSLRRIEELRGSGEVGTTWRDVTALGARPRMEVTEVDAGRSWAEVGRWRGIEARLRLGFAEVPTGTGVTATVASRPPCPSDRSGGCCAAWRRTPSAATCAGPPAR